jgi:nicotinamide-nucleotide amidase
MNASIILVGTELLNGGMIDTNSIYIAEQLNKYGVNLVGKYVVGDEINEIIDTIKFAKEKSELVILSGGLGPTIDDLTKVAIAKYLGKDMIVDEEELMELKEKFKNRKIEFLNNNVKEVEKPIGAISFKNDVGMAPAIYIEGIAAFPGVPKELYNMFPKFLEFYFGNEKNRNEIYIKDLLFLGIPESHLENEIKEFFTDKNITYEFLVKDYGIIVRLQTKSDNKNNVEKIVEKIYNKQGNKIYGEDNERLETIVVSLLKKMKYRISTAESCTGGALANQLVAVPGVSDVFYESIVSYANKSKMERLGVKKETLKTYGAVSEEVASEMLDGLITEVGISTTGIAGPTGGTNEKPVGLVYIGYKINKNKYIEKHFFKGNREEIRNKAVLYALFNLSKLLRKDVEE